MMMMSMMSVMMMVMAVVVTVMLAEQFRDEPGGEYLHDASAPASASAHHVVRLHGGGKEAAGYQQGDG